MSFVRRLSLPKSKHVRGLLRAGAYVAGLSVVLGAVQLRAARAEVRNRTVELGRQMLQLANASDHDVNKLTMNGQPIWLGSSTSSDSALQVLDRYEADCQKNAAQNAEGWRELAKKLDEKKESQTLMQGGVMRAGSPEEGTVVCFTKSESSKPTLKEAVQSFVETGELGALGNLRYAYAKQSPKGMTTVLTAWTDDRFNLADLVAPELAEKRGADFQGIPRPVDSSRLMSVQIENTPFGINIYRSKQGPSNVAKFYDGEMVDRGWLALDAELGTHMAMAGEENKAGAIGRLYEQNGVVVTLATHLEDGDTITTIGLAGVVSTDGSTTDTGTKASGRERRAPPASAASGERGKSSAAP